MWGQRTFDLVGDSNLWNLLHGARDNATHAALPRTAQTTYLGSAGALYTPLPTDAVCAAAAGS